MKSWKTRIRLALTALGLLAVAGCGSDSATGRSNQETSENSDVQKQLPESKNKLDQPTARSFRFHYAITLTELKPNSKARVWIPVAQSTPHQQIKIVNTTLPDGYRKTGESTYGNQAIYFEATASENGTIPLEIVYEVNRKEVLPESGEPFDNNRRNLFLRSSKLVPVGGKPKELFLTNLELTEDARSIARRLYDQVDDHVKYDKPAGGDWGRGDAVWVCDSKYGNCTDFHSLFISLCRSVNIPAKFEIGFPLPEKRGTGEVGGYHCWAWFAENNHWMPVDISEADKHPELKEYYFGHLSADRVAFTTGRDLQLKPAPQTGPINFLVYPHVEVDGIVHREMTKQFRYADME